MASAPRWSVGPSRASCCANHACAGASNQASSGSWQVSACVEVRRRAKYLLIDLDHGTLIAHLGMSGSLRVLPVAAPLLAHDHYDLVLDTGQCLRFNDPRRFGSLHWCTGAAEDHPLLASLGPEPLEPGLDAAYLAAKARGRRAAVKIFLMDQRIVVGVGNIYASEALFRAGIRPRRAAGRIRRGEWERLVTRGPCGARRGHSRRRHDLAGLCEHGRHARLFQPATLCL